MGTLTIYIYTSDESSFVGSFVTEKKPKNTRATCIILSRFEVKKKRVLVFKNVMIIDHNRRVTFVKSKLPYKSADRRVFERNLR